MSDNAKPNSIYQDRTGMEFYNPERKEIYDRFDEFVDIVFVQGKQIDWMASCKEGNLVARNEDFKELLVKDGAKVYAPLLGKDENGNEKWNGEYYSDKKAVGDWKQIRKINLWAESVKKDPKLKNLLNHLTYIWSLAPVGETKLYENIKDNKKETIFPITGLWSTGTGDSQKPYDFLALTSLMFATQQKKEHGEIFDSVNGFMSYAKKYFIEGEYKDKNPPIKNAFLHFCDADNFSTYPIVRMQNNLVKILSVLLCKEKKDEIKGEKNLSEKIKILHHALVEITGLKNQGCIFGRFDDYLKNEDNGVSDLSKLKFKKAVILYGPPGTSKTYTAKELAKAVLQDYCIEKCIELNMSSNKDDKDKEKNQYVCNIQDVLCNITNYIHRVQLHPNYSYEDFIWGYEIKDSGKGSSVSLPKKGYFLDLLEKMKADEMPHVLILDEINRVDLSKLFGELFSAIENRGEDVDLPISFPDSNGNVNQGEKYKINIPNNLFIIGTMNEIDFSLERIDFALRRRFAWIFKKFEKEVLKKMLEEKDGDFDYEDYIKLCEKLNKKIETDTENFGKKYVIGHTIFADIADIRQQLVKKSEINSASNDDDGKYSEARDLLWEISIKPLLEAYLGNMDETDQENKIKDFAKSFGVDDGQEPKSEEIAVTEKPAEETKP